MHITVRHCFIGLNNVCCISIDKRTPTFIRLFKWSGIKKIFKNQPNDLQILSDKWVVKSLVTYSGNRPVARIHSSFIGQR